MLKHIALVIAVAETIYLRDYISLISWRIIISVSPQVFMCRRQKTPGIHPFSLVCYCWWVILWWWHVNSPPKVLFIRLTLRSDQVSQFVIYRILIFFFLYCNLTLCIWKLVYWWFLYKPRLSRCFIFGCVPCSRMPHGIRR